MTDTQVYEIVGRTAKTLKLRRTKDWYDGPATVNTYPSGPNSYPVRFTHQVPNTTAPVQTVRLRNDGSYRLASWSALRPTKSQTEPTSRVDYRF